MVGELAKHGRRGRDTRTTGFGIFCDDSLSNPRYCDRANGQTRRRRRRKSQGRMQLKRLHQGTLRLSIGLLIEMITKLTFFIDQYQIFVVAEQRGGTVGTVPANILCAVT